MDFMNRTAIQKNVHALLLAILALVFFIAQPLHAQTKNVFEIISVSKSSVKFRTLAETKLYSVALVSGEKIFEGGSLSLVKGDVKLSNGSTIREGSDMPMPVVVNAGEMTLPKGAVLEVSGFGTPKTFTMSKVRFTTAGNATMVYNVSKSSWDSVGR